MCGITIYNWIFQYEDIIIFIFDVGQSCRARQARSCARDHFQIQWEGIEKNWKLTIYIENVFECMENVCNNISIVFSSNDDTTGCKFDVHQCGRARWSLFYRWRPFSNPLSKFHEKLKIKPLTIENV